ncbi:FAD-dependent oxidoreductase [Microbacterium sp. M3]|uniref:FAD-dependent oxidoreductase n=1 Tax=Microbacterium arthrosphaerae TaxID=792652 RepID=A0ABU4H402_9MICO|nr:MULTISPECIES: FAD-dependent oxidoreductase [Microbacterium]MDW4574046.1 FAD-dependent oxidoreductase [Microbacterium arthrosphaerae]MDW7607901.1 FAD-dependent oxidoreductase [Microbacterium sp. M3]
MTRVVMLGGGYVTLHAYATLARRRARDLRSGDLEIMVLSADTAHRFHGFTGELVAGMVDRDRLATPLGEAMPLARIVTGRAVSIDPVAQSVSYRAPGEAAEQTVTYDHLVVGTGATEPTAAVAGLGELGFTLRGPDEIAALADHLATVPGSPVVVAGGGIAGTELAAAIADRGHPVTLVHSGVRLMPEWSDQPRLVTHAAAELDRLGVRVVTGRRLTEVTPTAAILSDGSSLPTTTVVAAVGQRPVRIAGLDPWRDDRGRLLTQPTLAVRYGVWAAGDGARVEHPVTGEPVPANALWAMKGGDHIGRSIARRLSRRSPRRFTYRGLGRAASFGFGRGISELYGVPFTGAVAWLLRLVFFLRFMPSRRRAAGVVADLARVAATPAGGRGIRSSQPLPSMPARVLTSESA